MINRLKALLLIIFSKQYIVITESDIVENASPMLINYGCEHLESLYNDYNLQEDALQEFYDTLNYRQ